MNNQFMEGNMGDSTGVMEFQCVKEGCKTMISFTVNEMSKDKKLLCDACKNEYSFDDKLIENIQKFDNLIRAVKDAEDILGSTNVAIDIENNTIKVPYRLLLTRLSTLLTLKIGDEELHFRFRVEPLKENEFMVLK